MNKIIYNLVFNRKKSLNKKGMALVQVEIYLNRKKKYFSTKIYLLPNQWNNKKQMVKSHPNKDALNRKLYSYIAEMEKIELQLWQKGKEVTLELLKSSLVNKDNSSFISFYSNEQENSLCKESTKRNHLSTLVLLQQFKKEIYFSDITFEFISSFDLYLQNKGYHINTIAKHMKHLKRYINIAINKELMDIHKYAFRKYKIRMLESKHTHLTPMELSSLEGLSLAPGNIRLQKTLDAFLFCCYTGLRYSDFTSLTSNNIVHYNNEVWLVYKTIKTNVEIRLPLYLLFEGKCLDVIKRYGSSLNNLFQLRDNSNVNKELIRISRLVGLDKRISFHTARHTNATLLIYKGANITTVQKLLGHKSLRTTQVYSSIMDMTVVKDLEKCNQGIY